MTERHWTEQQQIAHLYGVGPEDGHLAGCPECRERAGVLAAVRAGQREEHVSDALLAEQRRRIWRRVEQPRRNWRWQVVSGLATAALAVAFWVVRPDVPSEPEPVMAVTVPTDAEFFAEVSALAEAAEPQAGSPVRGLFME